MRHIYSLTHLLCFILTFSNFTHAGDTEILGGNGGIKDFSRSCPSGKHITGAQVKYGGVIDKIRFRCTSISQDGRWLNSSHSWTSYTTSSYTNPISTISSALCQNDHWVAGFEVKTKKTSFLPGNSVLGAIGLWCVRANASRRLDNTGMSEEAGKTSIQYPWSTRKKCPSDELAHSGKGKSGRYVDNLYFSCVRVNAN